MELFPVNPAGTLLLSGAIDDWGLLKRHGVTTIVDLDGSIDPGLPEVPNEILYVYFPIVDEDLPDLTTLDAVARLVADLAARRHIVLVHCLLGLNRSNLLVGAALTYLGLTGQEAVAHLRSVQPGALFNETFARHVRELPARRLEDR
jgi:protein-tyrosine phosphatase